MKKNYPNTSNSLLKNSVLFDRFFHLMAKKTAFLFLLTSFTVTIYAQESKNSSIQTDLMQSGSCKVDLKVEKDRNIRSTPPEGTYYSMIITNTGSSADTFSLSTVNINSSCSNTDRSSTAGNVNLVAEFLDTKLVPINEVSLSPGQSVNFFAQVTIPVGTAMNKWCCTQIVAVPKNCSNFKANIVLHTLVINPNED
jgi:hypothetical protein